MHTGEFRIQVSCMVFRIICNAMSEGVQDNCMIAAVTSNV